MLKDVLINLNSVSFSNHKKNIIENISLKVHLGEIITIIGPNGTGKSTLAKILIGLIKPTKGERWAKENLIFGYVPQRISFDSNLPLPVIDFLVLKSKIIKTDPYFEMLLNEFSIKKLVNSQMHNLSGGEMQRVLLVKALLQKPDILILDEPTQGLDINGQSEFYKLLETIRAKRKISIIMISHDLYMVMKTTDQVICLNHHICCQGTPEQIVNDKIYQEIFSKIPENALAIYKHQHDHHH